MKVCDRIRWGLALAFGAWAFSAGLALADPAPALPPVEAYGKLPAMDMPTLSPSGDRYAFVIDQNGERGVGVVTTGGAAPIEFPVGKVKVVGMWWAGEDHLIIRTSSTVKLDREQFSRGKSELNAAVVLNVVTRKAISVFIDPQQQRVMPTVAGYFGSTQIDGRWYGFFSTFTYESSSTGMVVRHSDGWIVPDLYRVDLDTGEIHLATYGEPEIRSWLVAPDGHVAARSLYNNRYQDWHIRVGPLNGAMLLDGKGRYGGASILGFGRTPDTVLVQVDDDTAGDKFLELPLGGGPPRSTTDAESVRGLLIDPNTHLWIGVENDNDQRDATLFASPASARLNAVMTAFADHRPQLVSHSADFNSVIVLTQGDGDAGSYWLVNVAKQSADRLGERYPDIDAAFVGPVKTVVWKAADGLALQGVLTLPPDRPAKALPIVVMPHGGPLARDYPGFDYWAQAFAARGYAVFQPNFRGSTGYGAALRDAGKGEWGRKMQTDVSDGLAELARQGIVDPKRACIVGWSYGGYAAQAGITVQQGLYRCAVSMAGVSDLGGMIDYGGGNDDNAPTRYWKDYMGVKSWSEHELNDISPIKLAARADAPILLLHGDNDTVVPLKQSQDMAAALKAAGKTVELQVLPGADHWLLEEDQRMAMLKASVAFVLKYDPPDPAPAPAAVADASAH